MGKKKQFGISRLLFPNLEGLIFFNQMGCGALKSLLNIKQINFPSLRYLSCRVDKNGDLLSDLSKLKSLDHLELEFAYNFDVFAHINSPLKALSIIGTEKHFPINNISKIPTLEYLWLNGIQAPIDCSIFAGLRQLKELNVLNSKKIQHPAKLLLSKQLNSLFFLNCGQPFKKIKDEFAKRKYERLDIKFS